MRHRRGEALARAAAHLSRVLWSALQIAFTLAVLGSLVAIGIYAAPRAGLRIAAGAVAPSSTAAADVAVDLTPAERLETAAKALEDAVAGEGFTFDVVARSTLHAKQGGPQIEIPDPIDRYRSLGFADEYYVGASIAEGTVTSDGFWLQMRAGPATAEATPDFEKAPITLAALVKDGKTWRNDGEGWYQTDTPPGIGLDPKTVGLLPKLLRDAADPSLAGVALVDGKPATNVAATGKVADAPGLMAIDAASFTELSEPIEFALDEQGRLVQLSARMRNTNIEIYDLFVDTVVTFRYDSGPLQLPDPVPTAP
jgi:hypothetical protein